MVNFFTVTSGKLIECQKQEIGKLIGCQCGKQIQCQVVNFFIDIHIFGLFEGNKEYNTLAFDCSIGSERV